MKDDLIARYFKHHTERQKLTAQDVLQIAKHHKAQQHWQKSQAQKNKTIP